METEVIIRRVADLEPEEYVACHRLNMHHNGMMQRTLKAIRYDENNYYMRQRYKDNRVAILRDAETLIIYGWALAFKEWDNWNVHYYVRKDMRRRGFGRTLDLAIRKAIRGPLLVHPWSEASKGFFDTMMKSNKRMVNARA